MDARELWDASELVVIDDAGHPGGAAITAALMAATDRFANSRRCRHCSRRRSTARVLLSLGCERLPNRVSDDRNGRDAGVWRRAIEDPAAPASVQRQPRRADYSFHE